MVVITMGVEAAKDCGGRSLTRMDFRDWVLPCLLLAAGVCAQSTGHMRSLPQVWEKGYCNHPPEVLHFV